MTPSNEGPKKPKTRAQRDVETQKKVWWSYVNEMQNAIKQLVFEIARAREHGEAYNGELDWLEKELEDRRVKLDLTLGKIDQSELPPTLEELTLPVKVDVLSTELSGARNGLTDVRDKFLIGDQTFSKEELRKLLERDPATTLEEFRLFDEGKLPATRLKGLVK